MLYNDTILDHYHNPRNFGEMKKPTFTVESRNPICGDEITLYIRMQKDTIEDIMFYGMGCAVSTAAASILTEQLKGKTLGQIKKINIKKMFKIFDSGLVGHKLTCIQMSTDGLSEIIKKAEESNKKK